MGQARAKKGLQCHPQGASSVAMQNARAVRSDSSQMLKESPRSQTMPGRLTIPMKSPKESQACSCGVQWSPKMFRDSIKHRLHAKQSNRQWMELTQERGHVGCKQQDCMVRLPMTAEAHIHVALDTRYEAT